MSSKKNINGYKLIQEFKTAGAGQSRWSFAKKDGREYFIKEFLAPKYPTDEAPGSKKIKQKKRKKCKEFEERQRNIQSSISEKCAPGGNLVYARDFFREGPQYYKVTDKVNVSSLSIKEISSLPLNKRVLILLTVTSSLRILHNVGVVHGDLKPDNILVKNTKTGNYAAKLIDFDDSFFDGDPPPVDEVVGDQVYYSPELSNYVKGKPHRPISDKSDIFALGLIFAQYITGNLPAFDGSEYKYSCDAVLDGHWLTIRDEGIPSKLVELIRSMIKREPSKRPDAQSVFRSLKDYRSVDDPVDDDSSGTDGRLTGTLIDNKDERESSESSDNNDSLRGDLID